MIDVVLKNKKVVEITPQGSSVLIEHSVAATNPGLQLLRSLIEVEHRIEPIRNACEALKKRLYVIDDKVQRLQTRPQASASDDQISRFNEDFEYAFRELSRQITEVQPLLAGQIQTILTLKADRLHIHKKVIKELNNIKKGSETCLARSIRTLTLKDQEFKAGSGAPHAPPVPDDMDVLNMITSALGDTIGEIEDVSEDADGLTDAEHLADLDEAMADLAELEAMGDHAFVEAPARNDDDDSDDDDMF